MDDNVHNSNHMSLSTTYSLCGLKNERRTKYFNAAISFLQEYQWIYNFPNTDVLIENVFDKFPTGWRHRLEELSCEDLNRIPFGFYKENWPEDMIKFVFSLRSLKPNHEIFQANPIADETVLPKSFSRGLSPKKQHEIIRLARVVDKYCKQEGVTTVIDVGAGLGYLSHLLHEVYNYKVVAIESDTVRFNSALRRQDKYHSASKDSVRYFQHHVDENSAVQIDRFLQNWYDNGRVFDEPTCLIGLHACADLTVIAFDIFNRLDYIKLAIIMPCCYHKLAMRTTSSSNVDKNVDGGMLRDSLKFSHESKEPEYFCYFPLSESLTKEYVRHEGWNFLKRSFMRIACQSSASVWCEMSDEEHRAHSVSHMRRAVLQLYTIQNKYALVKLKRKCMNRHTSSKCDFDTYLKQLDQGYYLARQDSVPCTPDGFYKAYENDTNSVLLNEKFAKTTDNCNNDVTETDGKGATTNMSTGNRLTFTMPDVRDGLTKLWRKYEPMCPLIEILTCLQNSIQDICENLILLDRVTYIEEQHPDVSCRVVKVMDDNISPRCRAMIALKSTPVAVSTP